MIQLTLDLNTMTYQITTTKEYIYNSPVSFPSDVDTWRHQKVEETLTRIHITCSSYNTCYDKQQPKCA